MNTARLLLRRLPLLLLAFVIENAAVAAGGVVPVAKPAELPVPEVQLSQAAVQSAFQILRQEYIRRDELTFDELNRAALQGLLDRLKSGANLIPLEISGTKKVDEKVVAEKLTPSIGLLRPHALTLGSASVIEKHLAEFEIQGIRHLVLDLRYPGEPGDFDVAAAVVDLFVPEGQVLFKLKQIGQTSADLRLSTRPAAWSGSIVILADADTTNVGETIAAVLHHRKQALVVGALTQGATVRYETLPIDSQWALRFARAEMLLDDDTSLFTRGITPDLRVDLSAAAKHQMFAQTTSSVIDATVKEKARPRYNEAALVSGKNPELESYIRRSKGEDIENDQLPVRDTVLQRALDMIRGRDHFQEAKLDWKNNLAPGKRSSGSADTVIPKAVPVSGR
ncbi:MAG: hypothetical protein H7A55_11575 [Verrucomicrobiaceae bacterium]|nr:hypothetical protein [Verrucomicrobiaceae bacterium]